MITQVTEKETQLSHMLSICSEALKAVTAERDALKGELALWVNPERSVIREMAALVKENKTLRDALETIAGTTDGTDCNEVARAALEKRND